MKMRRLLWCAFLAAAAGLPGCGQQSFADGLAVICQSPVEARQDLDGTLDRAVQAAIVSEWIAAHLDNGEARAFFASLAPSSPSEKASRLREAAARAGLDECPVADVWTTPMTLTRVGSGHRTGG